MWDLYPYSNFHELNQDWILSMIKKFENELKQAIDYKTIHYADPLQWNITTQYAPNTVVVDENTGIAYISKDAVPSGVLLSDANYWMVIFDYQKIYNKIMSGVAFNDKDNETASKDLLVNDLVWYHGNLYRVTRAISEGSKYIVGTNLIATTIESLLSNYYGRDRVTQLINDTLNVSGDYTVNAGDIAETANNVTIHSTRDTLLDADGNLTEQVTGNREIDIDGDDSVHVDGITSTNRGGAVTEVYGSSVNKRVTGAFTENYDDSATSTFNGTRIYNAKDVTKTVKSETVTYADTLKIISPEVVLGVENHITYGNPSEYNKYFKSIPLKDYDDNIYQVLVGSDGTNLLTSDKKTFVVIGDSFSTTTLTGQPLWWQWIERYTGKTCVTHAVDGTGYVRGDNNFRTQLDQCAQDVDRDDVAFVIILGGLNDLSVDTLTASDFGDTVNKTLQKAKTLFPTSLLIVAGIAPFQNYNFVSGGSCLTDPDKATNFNLNLQYFATSNGALFRNLQYLGLFYPNYWGELNEYGQKHPSSTGSAYLASAVMGSTQFANLVMPDIKPTPSSGTLDIYITSIPNGVTISLLLKQPADGVIRINWNGFPRPAKFMSLHETGGKVYYGVLESGTSIWYEHSGTTDLYGEYTINFS